MMDEDAVLYMLGYLNTEQWVDALESFKDTDAIEALIIEYEKAYNLKVRR